MPSHHRTASALLVCLCASLLAPTSTALAQPKAPAKMDEARARFERGKKLYDEGAFDAALIEFQRAYELAPSYKILYNIGQVHRQRNDYANAMRSYERYLKEAGSDIDAKRRAETEKEIAELKGRVATLQIVSSVAGAEIFIDDESVGKTPLPQGILVNSGKRKVTASKDGRTSAPKIITVAGSETLKVDIELTEAGSGAPPPPPPATATTTSPPPPPPPPPGTATSTPPPPPEKSSAHLIAWGVTGAFGVGAAVTGVLALGAASDLKDRRNSATTTRSQLDDASSKTKTMALVSDLFTAGTVVAGAVAIYLTVREPPKEQPTAGRFWAPKTVRVGFAPGSLQLSGNF